jgi:hypothetical protein
MPDVPSPVYESTLSAVAIRTKTLAAPAVGVNVTEHRYQPFPAFTMVAVELASTVPTVPEEMLKNALLTPWHLITIQFLPAGFAYTEMVVATADKVAAALCIAWTPVVVSSTTLDAVVAPDGAVTELFVTVTPAFVENDSEGDNKFFLCSSISSPFGASVTGS